MDLYLLPLLIRVGLAIAYFTGIIRSVTNFNLMSYRWRCERAKLWLSYFLLNLIFNCLMALALVIVQVQSIATTMPIIKFEINWLFVIPIVSSLIIITDRYLSARAIDRRSMSVIVRMLLMMLLLPMPGNYLWSPMAFNLLFIAFTIFWVASGYHYLYNTRRYLSTHFTDYTKLKAFEVYPHGIVVTSPDGHVLSMNPKALDVLSNINTADDGQIVEVLESYDGLYRKGRDTYRINRFSMMEYSRRFIVWEIVKVTELINIQAEISRSTAATRSAWEILTNILEQLKQSVHLEEQTRLQQYLHDVMGETFSVMSYSMQAIEGRPITKEERYHLLHMLEQMYLKLEDRTSGGSDSSFRAMQRSFNRIGLELFFHGKYPESYHYRHLTYQVLREAANNSLKHGGATQVHLMMESSPTEYRFSITNNGTLDPEPNEQGMGLKGMYRLVNDWSGKIYIDPNDKYRIDVSLPIH